MNEVIKNEIQKENFKLAENLMFLNSIMDKIIEVENINNQENN